MDLPKYQLSAENSLKVFEFMSIGSKGHIPKLIMLTDLNMKCGLNLTKKQILKHLLKNEFKSNIMNTIEELNRRKIPIVKIDNSLKKYHKCPKVFRKAIYINLTY